MVWQALYRKWRSRDFDEVVGQDHVTTTLRNAVRAGRVTHAYLFCGPRGTGKTSVARILAKAVNCLAPVGERPCNECAICRSVNEARSMDLIEIDAASNRGIDEIRDLREKVHFTPSEMRTKFYIIDEAHMLTNEAFNALLKTLEEPPAHAIFVLATTEPHKIPPTVLSRCQRFDFRRIPLQQITAHLQTICQAEGFIVEPAALEFIGRAATGSLRDAISLLDQLAGHAGPGETITLQQARYVLGAATSEAVSDLVDHWLAGGTADGLRLLGRVNDEGADLRQFNRQVVEHLRGVLLLKAAGDAPEKGRDLVNVPADVRAIMEAQAQRADLAVLARAIRLFNEADRDLRASAQGEPLLPLELAFVEAILPPAEAAPAAQATPTANRPTPAAAAVQPAPAKPAPAHASPGSDKPAQERPAASAQRAQPARAPSPAPVPAGTPAPRPAAPIGAGDIDQVKAHWNQIVAAMRARNKSLQAILRDGEPRSVEDDVVVIAFQYAFHRDRLDTPQNRRIVDEVLSQELGRPFHARFVPATEESPAQPRTDADQMADDPLIRAAVSMGGRIAEIKR